MQKKLKVTIVLIIFIVFASILPNKVQAGEDLGIFDQAQSFLETGAKNPGMLEGHEKMQDSISSIFTKIIGMSETSKTGFEKLIDVIWSIGLLTIFVSTIILGVKYMMVLPEERSRIKQATTPYILGVVIIFGAVTIWRLIIVVLDGSLNS